MIRVFALCAAVLAGLAVQSKAADLTITVVGATPSKGQFLISIFDRSEAWMKQPVVSHAKRIAASGTATARIDLPAGTYAIAVIHDANVNGEMDTNALGIPTEAFGFSNSARARFGPPAFGDATFQLTEQGGRTTVSLNRAKR